MDPVDLLILGAGWTSQFLIPLLQKKSITYAATTTTGHPSYTHPTIPFVYDPTSPSLTPYTLLPPATTILITFPLKGNHQSPHLVSQYLKTHPSLPTAPKWIQLGSTGIFNSPHWNTHDSPYDTTNPRAIAEDELLRLNGCVLNLSGLYGGERDPRNWVARVATTKGEVEKKKALHVVHGEDVARAIVAVHENFEGGKRWLVSDLRVYDWWDLIQEWGAEVSDSELASGSELVRDNEPASSRAESSNSELQSIPAEPKKLQYKTWIGELMFEHNVRSLPRSAEDLGRVLDSRAFWGAMGIWPARGRV